ncbi:MAG: phenylacetic acid degradation protein PaaN, partial [Phyllobacteriaceae bacterium]|nr:phenylacetic acid degradation protein PaaN [Phyllobacteriaceae bacterium]
MSELFATHRDTLEAARRALASRGFWSAYSEVPKTYGEPAAAEGEAAWRALLDRPFVLGDEDGLERVGGEVSPFGPALGITYAVRDPADLVARAEAAAGAWAAATVETRAGIALEILARLNRDSFTLARAVDNTTGQAFAMAFQAGGPHAQDRGLEAVAVAVDELTRIPATATWEKPVGRSTLRIDKEWRIVPRGVALVIGCATFPTWNGYPAIFADLVTGNPVIVKPHPAAVLPLALTVRIAREVLTEEGFSPDVVQLAVDVPGRPLAEVLARDPAVGIVDFTGSSAFGTHLRTTLRDTQVFTEEAGVNTVVIDSTADFAGLCRNLAFSLALYSGQMCTTPQAIFVPRDGISTDLGVKSFEEVGAGLVAAIDDLLADPARALGVLGAIQNPATLARLDEARRLGRILRDSASLQVEGARTATPLLLAVEAADRAAWGEERFGPISFLVATEGDAEGVALAARSAKERGAITA